MYGGSPVTLLVDGDFSLKVLNSSGVQEYYVPNRTWNIAFKPGNYYYPDADAADQGVTGSSNTIKYYVDLIGADNATIFLRHGSSSATTTYTLTTSETIPANITLKVERGAVIDGAGTLTLDNLSQIDVGDYQVFDDDFQVFADGFRCSLH
jgi:hypothetical protein